MADTLVGTGTLFRLALRRDRWLLPGWALGFAAMAWFSATATANLYPAESGRVEAANAVNATPALVALYGRIYDPASLGALALFKMTAFGAALVGVLMVVVTVRHTRAEEESNRLELLGAGVVGRDAPLAAALMVGIRQQPADRAAHRRRPRRRRPARRGVVRLRDGVGVRGPGVQRGGRR